MHRTLKNILVTGGAGFIGSNFIHYVFDKTPFKGKIVNLDSLSYCGNLENLASIEKRFGINGNEEKGRYIFCKGDICDSQTVDKLFFEYDIDTVVHFAAESHVDRSIAGPEAFIRTNITGTFNMLECARRNWTHKNADGIKSGVLFHHVSTDEVFGSLGANGYFTENTPYAPRSPYSASKAASDHLVLAWHSTYGLPVTLSNCSNNYGPYQFPEKLIPLMILNIKEKKPLPVYGDGKNIRDWLYVEDHNSAVWLILNKGKAGQTYNIGGENEWENIRLLQKLIELTVEKLNEAQSPSCADGAQTADGFYRLEDVQKTIRFVSDRPGHDRRYAIDCSKIKKELGWKQSSSFEEGLKKTVGWYLENPLWIEGIKTGSYRTWIDQNYTNR
ncbi:dTDP-glucose 4,6-dehydratase [Treponema sp. OMZ 840]|uniref:dTDP-glucose 4,6-dehydratase n=1 Tax=Treponema sp. OMZ 840 TaxID=244313 RepID=UPI003D945ADC